MTLSRWPTRLLVVLILAIAVVRGQDDRSPDAMATLRGTVAGVVPPARLVNLASDPFCATQAPLQLQQDDVIVFARPLNQTPLPVPATTVVLDRVGCRYVPQTITLQVGQKLLVRNSDQTAHNAHAWPRVNTAFNTALPRQGTEFVHVFQNEELPFPIRDDIHNWESAYVGVFSHPYHTVSKLNGKYQLRLPAGAYDVVVWHERLGQLTQSFVALTGDDREISFDFK